MEGQPRSRLLGEDAPGGVLSYSEHIFILKSIFKSLHGIVNHKPATLPETNSSPLKMDGWNTTFLLG